jgi:uncharacterized protein YraI
MSNKSEKSSDPGFWKTFGLVVLIFIAAGLVLVLGVMLGGLLVDRAGSDVADPNDPTVAPPAPPPGAPHAVANAYVNVRSGPSTDYPIYGVASPGQSAEIAGVSPDRGWWVLKIPTTASADGLGWVSAGYVTAFNAENVPVVQPPPPPPDIKPPTPESGSKTVVTSEPVNVRSGPGNQFPSYGKVHRGTVLIALGKSADAKWVTVKISVEVTPTGVGWVNASYLEPFDPGALPLVEP